MLSTQSIGVLSTKRGGVRLSLIHICVNHPATVAGNEYLGVSRIAVIVGFNSVRYIVHGFPTALHPLNSFHNLLHGQAVVQPGFNLFLSLIHI